MEYFLNCKLEYWQTAKMDTVEYLSQNMILLILLVTLFNIYVRKHNLML